MKWLLAILTLFLSLNTSAQIRVDDVGDGWKSRVDSALELIKVYDPQKYNILTTYCDHIGYWNGNFSTTEGPSMILISTREMKAGNINNIAAVLVHESLHLYYLTSVVKIDEHAEEANCYAYELDFLYHIPDVEYWLIDHAKKQIKSYTKL